jgi:hypothetical protein
MNDKLLNILDINDYMFLLADQKIISKGLSSAIRTAIKSVIEILDIESEKIDNINVDELINKFKELAESKMTAATIKNYSSKFKKGMTLYIDYCKNPEKKIKAKKKSAKKKAAKKQKSTVEKAVAVENIPSNMPVTIEILENPKLYSFPIPIRRNLMVELSNIPHDLSKKEAQKICNVLNALSNE